MFKDLKLNARQSGIKDLHPNLSLPPPLVKIRDRDNFLFKSPPPPLHTHARRKFPLQLVHCIQLDAKASVCQLLTIFWFVTSDSRTTRVALINAVDGIDGFCFQQIPPPFPHFLLHLFIYLFLHSLLHFVLYSFLYFSYCLQFSTT